MNENVFCIHVPLWMFEKTMDEKSYSLKVRYEHPSIGMVQIEILDNLVQDYYQKFYLELISGENSIDVNDDSYQIPVGLRYSDDGFELLSVNELIENSEAETLEIYTDDFEVNGIKKELYIIAFPKEPMIKALFTQESLVSHLGSVGKIILTTYDIEEVINNDSGSEDYIPLVFEALESKELALVGIYLEDLPELGREKSQIKILRDK